MDTQEMLLKGFIEPQPDYRPVTMWFVGDDLSEYELTTQLETFKSKGINVFLFFFAQAAKRSTKRSVLYLQE